MSASSCDAAAVRRGGRVSTHVALGRLLDLLGAKVGVDRRDRRRRARRAAAALLAIWRPSAAAPAFSDASVAARSLRRRPAGGVAIVGSVGDGDAGGGARQRRAAKRDRSATVLGRCGGDAGRRRRARPELVVRHHAATLGEEVGVGTERTHSIDGQPRTDSGTQSTATRWRSGRQERAPAVEARANVAGEAARS